MTSNELAILIGILITMYFLPALIGNIRRHRNGNAITLANLFFGWTVFGWIACLIWATTDNVRSK